MTSKMRWMKVDQKARHHHAFKKRGLAPKGTRPWERRGLTYAWVSVCGRFFGSSRDVQPDPILAGGPPAEAQQCPTCRHALQQLQQHPQGNQPSNKSGSDHA